MDGIEEFGPRDTTEVEQQSPAGGREVIEAAGSHLRATEKSLMRRRYICSGNNAPADNRGML